MLKGYLFTNLFLNSMNFFKVSLLDKSRVSSKWVVRVFNIFYTLFPSVLKKRYTISFSVNSILRVHTFRNIHYIVKTGLHEASKSVSSDFSSNSLGSTNDTVRSSFEDTTSKDLRGFTNLESKAILRNFESLLVSKSVLCIEATFRIKEVVNNFTIFISINSWTKTGQSTVVIVPSAPVIIYTLSFLRREVVK